MKKSTALLLSICFIALSCIEKKDTENEKPAIKILSPMPCDTLYYGELIRFRATISDSSGLGNISMDLHNNFGHHSHGVHESCTMDDPKDAINPFANAWIFSLPKDKKSFIFDTTIALPKKKNDSIFYDTGDYHFHIYITDNDGYQSFTSLDVKILVQ